LYWAASCGGCEIGMLDIDEKILDVTAAADIVFWPVAIDTKYKDVEALEDQSIWERSKRRGHQRKRRRKKRIIPFFLLNH